MPPKAAKKIHVRQKRNIDSRNLWTMAYAQYVWIVLNTHFGNALERLPLSATNVEKRAFAHHMQSRPK